MAFKLRSGNTTNFKNMGSSPAKQKYTITWSDEEAKKRHEEKIKKEEEKKKKLQEKVDAQIEGTYELTEEDIKKMKEDEAKNPKRPMKQKTAIEAIKEVEIPDTKYPNQYKSKMHSQREIYKAKLRGDYVDLRGKSKEEEKKTLKKHGITEPKWYKDRSPAKQKYVKPTDYWYKVNGKKVSYSQYKKAWKEGVDERRPNLQTNDPDAFGIKAKHKKDRAKLKKHTVLTEQQTKNLKK